MILFLDIETTGLPKMDKSYGTQRFYHHSKLKIYDKARMVQFSFITFHKNGDKNQEYDFIIKPNGFTIPQESTNIHNISHDLALKNGLDISTVLDTFETVLDNTQAIVMHNAWFDRTILMSEVYRLGRMDLVDKIYNKRYYCTMRYPGIKDFVGIPSQYYKGFKNPQLSELHYKLFNKSINIQYQHNSLYDVKITAKCFFELVKRRMIP